MTPITILLLAITLTWVSSSRAKGTHPVQQEDQCNLVSSCTSCLKKSQCAWCITKSKCTKQSCGNDNVIYPPHVYALMSGPQFCPSVVQPEKIITLRSGKKESITVEITQIHLYMAYTTWKCRIRVGEVEHIVSASLVGANVVCGNVFLNNESNEPYLNGSVTVMWDNNKNFDGSFPFKLCRWDLDHSCDVHKNESDNKNLQE